MHNKNQIDFYLVLVFTFFSMVLLTTIVSDAPKAKQGIENHINSVMEGK